MDDQALVEGSVVFKDEDDPATKRRVRHSTACHKCRRMNRLGLCTLRGGTGSPRSPCSAHGHVVAAGAGRAQLCVPARLGCHGPAAPKALGVHTDIRSTAHAPGTALHCISSRLG